MNYIKDTSICPFLEILQYNSGGYWEQSPTVFGYTDTCAMLPPDSSFLRTVKIAFFQLNASTCCSLFDLASTA
jgi:hypothetical protein